MDSNHHTPADNAGLYHFELLRNEILVLEVRLELTEDKPADYKSAAIATMRLQLNDNKGASSLRR